MSAASSKQCIALAVLSCSLIVFSGALFAAATSQTPNSTASIVDAMSTTSVHRWDVFGGIGWSDYPNATNNNTVGITSSETDQLAQTSGGSNVGYTLGFARNYDLTSRTAHGVLQSVSIGGTFRYDPTTVNGQVYQFQDPNLNNYTYRYQARPITELMESDLLFHVIPKIYTAPFIVAGIGLSEAYLNYQETAQTGIPSTSALSGSNWEVKPDVAIGAGLLWDFHKKNLFLKTQYLYQYRGTANASVSGSSQGVPINLNEQSVDVLLGYRFK